MEYDAFIKSKMRHNVSAGIEVPYDAINSNLYAFQKHLTEWAINTGRCAIFADCGLGKTPIQLAWCDAITQATNTKAIILAPLAVADQTVREGQKFDIHVHHSRDGSCLTPITVTNYERLHYFDAHEFHAVVLDESSILKNYAGAYRKQLTEFMSHIPMRLLCSATPCPNDNMELGTSAEALGIMRRVEMLAQFFTHDGSDTSKWILKGHGQKAFWKWMASWARALRKPSDLLYDDQGYDLPSFTMVEHKVNSGKQSDVLFPLDALTLEDQRREKRSTLQSRCEIVADIANSIDRPFLAWCQLNDESRTIADMVPDAVEVTGSMSDDDKADKMLAFSRGDIRVLVTKPSIAGFGMNWQHCSDMSYFPTHSHEQFYQASRRIWRFGQTRPVTCHIVMSESEGAILENMKRKDRESSHMLRSLIDAIHAYQNRQPITDYNPTEKMEIPSWLQM